MPTNEIKDLLTQLITLPGLSGYEGPAREVIAAAWRPLVDELHVSKLGSLHGLVRGSGAEPRPRILLSAHMDAIGLMVTGIEQGWLRFTQVGGVDPRILPGLEVTVHGKRELPGVVAQPPAHLLPDEFTVKKSVSMQYMLIDTGLSEDEVRSLVRVGDLVSFASQPMDLSDDLYAGHSMDDRSCVAAVTTCLQLLKKARPAWDVWAVASVQEEVTFAGAYTSPFEIRPDLAVAIDVTFAKGPGGPADYRTVPLAQGPTLGWGPNMHPGVFDRFKDTADRLEIPYQVEVMPHHSGTDTYAMQVVAEGIPTATIGLPLRYMHTPVEIISLKDIERTGRLLAEFILTLEADSLAEMRWDDEEEA